MKKRPVVAMMADQIPDVCEVCGQTVDKRSAASIEHHATPRHLPFTGKRKRPSWL